MVLLNAAQTYISSNCFFFRLVDLIKLARSEQKIPYWKSITRYSPFFLIEWTSLIVWLNYGCNRIDSMSLNPIFQALVLERPGS